ARQVDYAKTIHSSGNDLLNLINDILDLSKIESGTVIVDVGEIRFEELHGFVERTFNHVAEQKGLEFRVSRSPELPKSMQTDSKRLQQILKNLLSNAFKFTRQGQVSLEMYTVAAASADEDAVIAFAVSDTGIGIPSDKQQIIFEAFQQADGSTSRKYGGTGLGLAISRELSRLLGGEIQLESAPGEGSRFTLYLPLAFAASAAARRTVVPARDTRAGAGVVVDQPQAVNTVVVQSSLVAEEIEDDRGAIGPGDRVILV